jgi:hypothetical protein
MGTYADGTDGPDSGSSYIRISALFGARGSQVSAYLEQVITVTPSTTLSCSFAYRPVVAEADYDENILRINGQECASGYNQQGGFSTTSGTYKVGPTTNQVTVQLGLDTDTASSTEVSDFDSVVVRQVDGTICI